MPGLAFGDGLSGDGGEESRVRGDADTAEIEAVGVEADSEGGFGLGWSAVVDLAGGDEECHAGVVELEMAGMAEIEGELRAARAVLRVTKFIFPAGVVEDSEEADDFFIGSVMAGEIEAVATDRAPVGGAVVSVRAETKLSGDELPERNFSGQEIGKHVFGRMVR